MVRCHEIFLRSIPRVELLLGYEGHVFSAAGDAAQNLLAITAVHPMREEAVNDLLVRAGASWDLVSGLVAARQLTLVQHDGHRYLVHRAGRAD